MYGWKFTIRIFFSWVKQIPTNSYFYWLLTTDCKISLSTHFICEDGGGEQALKVLVVYAGRKCLCQSLFVGNRIQSIKKKKKIKHGSHARNDELTEIPRRVGGRSFQQNFQKSHSSELTH